MRELWSATLPGRIADLPIYADNAIFVTTLNHELHKLNPVTGETFWSVQAEAQIGTTSPAYHKGKIYFTSRRRGGICVLHCIDSDNGKEMWKLDPCGDAGSCYIDDKNIYLSVIKELDKPSEIKGLDKKQIQGFACYSLEDRTEVWFHPCQGGVSVRASAVENRILVYGDSAGNVYGLDTLTGREIWRMNTADWIPPRVDDLGRIAIPYVQETPIIVNDVVLVTADTPGQTFGLDLMSGKVLWLYRAEDDIRAKDSIWNYSAMGVDDENWYCLTMFRRDPIRYFSVDIKTGKVVLEKDISMYREQMGLMNGASRTGLVVGDYHFVGVQNPPLIAAFNKNTGELAWTHSINKLDKAGDNRGIYADGKLIWFKNSGEIYCFE